MKTTISHADYEQVSAYAKRSGAKCSVDLLDGVLTLSIGRKRERYMTVEAACERIDSLAAAS